MFQKGTGMPSWWAWNKVNICAFFDDSRWLAIKKWKEWLNDRSVILLSSHFSSSYVRTIPCWRELPRCFKSADQSSTLTVEGWFLNLYFSRRWIKLFSLSGASKLFSSMSYSAMCKFLEGNYFQWTWSMSELDPEPSWYRDTLSMGRAK